MDEYAYDLFWHALNYRGAAILDAERCWQELQACSNRLATKAAEEERERAIRICYESGDCEEVARRIRAQE